MAFTKINERPFWICNSTDTKEVIAIDDGGVCYEQDTGFMYWFFAGSWNRKIPDYNTSLDFTRAQATLGHLYTISKKVIGVANDGYARIRVKAPVDKQLAFTITTAATGKAYFNSYLNSTYSNDGTALNIFNRKTDLLNDSGALAYLNPTISQLGVQRADDFINGTTGPQKLGGSMGDDTVTILMPGHDILIEVQNKAGTNQSIDVNFNINFIAL